MALPVTIRLFNTYLDKGGSPTTGSITVVSLVTLTSPGESSIQPVDELVEIDEDGNFELEVPATNTPNWSPQGFEYLIKENLATGVNTYRISVPYDSLNGEMRLVPQES